MTIPPKRRAEIDIKEEVDIVRVDPLFLERMLSVTLFTPQARRVPCSVRP